MTIRGKAATLSAEINRIAFDSWFEAPALEEQKKRAKRLLRNIADCLTPRQRRVLYMHYGVMGKEMSFEEIGLKLGLSTEDVGMICRQALKEAHQFALEIMKFIEDARRELPRSAHSSETVH